MNAIYVHEFEFVPHLYNAMEVNTLAAMALKYGSQKLQEFFIDYAGC
jgi:hypothetical protein